MEPRAREIEARQAGAHLAPVHGRELGRLLARAQRQAIVERIDDQHGGGRRPDLQQRRSQQPGDVAHGAPNAPAFAQINRLATPPACSICRDARVSMSMVSMVTAPAAVSMVDTSAGCRAETAPSPTPLPKLRPPDSNAPLAALPAAAKGFQAAAGRGDTTPSMSTARLNRTVTILF